MEKAPEQKKDEKEFLGEKRERERKRRKVRTENMETGKTHLKGLQCLGSVKKEKEKKKKEEKACVTNTCENGKEKNQTRRKKREKMRERERVKGEKVERGAA